MNKNYLTNALLQFEYYKQLGEQTFEQLDEQELFWEAEEGSNSIALIVQHISGNMHSRWTELFTSDGEKQWRNREGEFELSIQTRQELLQKWEAGWSCLFNALNGVEEKDFDREILIRNQRHTLVEALNRQMMHYAYHIGQIVLIGKMRKGAAWQSLSIPKGASKAYNDKKFSRGLRDGHFSEEE